MLNCGLEDLRLVQPRDGWPNPKAWPPASGADAVLDQARVFRTTADAVADLTTVFATTARARDMTKRVLTPRAAAEALQASAGTGGRAGVLFGKEAKGLHNDDVALADAVLTVPLNPAFASLNIAMSVLLVGYEWFQAAHTAPDAALTMPRETRPATREELLGLFEHLEAELDWCGFLRVKEKRPKMVRNLRNMLGRAALTEQEVRTLRGVITGLVTGPR